jgi:hypothetical protein
MFSLKLNAEFDNELVDVDDVIVINGIVCGCDGDDDDTSLIKISFVSFLSWGVDVAVGCSSLFDEGVSWFLLLYSGWIFVFISRFFSISNVFCCCCCCSVDEFAVVIRLFVVALVLDDEVSSSFGNVSAI